MKLCLFIVCSVMFVGLVAFDGLGFAANITPTTAAIGEGCVASGPNSTAIGSYASASGQFATAMGYDTTASGTGSTAMGFSTSAEGDFAMATGYGTTANGDYSWAGGRYMQVTHNAQGTFIWGYSDDSNGVQSISAANAFLIFPAGTAGNVGIGTKSPQNLLDLGTSNGKKLAVYQNGSGTDFYGIGISSDTLEFYAGAGATDTPSMVVKKATKRVGIGTTGPGYLLEVNGSAGKPDGGVWSNSSDFRLKDITGDYLAGLDEIVKLRPVTFFYKEDNPRGLPAKNEYIGFIAQEVQEVFPEAVSEGSDRYLDFNMHPVNVAVVNAIRELKTENDKLKAENEILKKKIERIEVFLGIQEVQFKEDTH